MIPELWQLFAAVVGYLAMLFVVAWIAELGGQPSPLARHPLTYALSLGVYATTWTYYGSVGFAATDGYLFLSVYMGLTLAFMLAPVMLRPLLRLVRDYQLTSLADLFAFRFPNRFTGVLVTVFMLMGILPYIALQIRAVVTSVQVLTQESAPKELAFFFCATVTLFAVLFGARQVTPREKHQGLVVAMAFESIVKLVAMLAVGFFALFGVFGGPGGLRDWLNQHPEAASAMYQPLHEGSWTTMLLLAFSAGFLLPRQFQMTFTENIEPRTLRHASWMFPLYLLLLNLPIPVLLWAGKAAGLEVAPDYYLLAITRQEPSGWLTMTAFVGGISAASAMIIVESLALAAMALNHLILPIALAVRPVGEPNLYRGLLWARRGMIALIIFTGYVTFLSVEKASGLVQLGLISFVAVAQFLPAIIGMLAWPRATRVGFLAGVTGGMTVWFLALMLPLLLQPDAKGDAWYFVPGLDSLGKWDYVSFLSLSVNTTLFVLGSLLSRPTTKELAADQACRQEAVLLLSRSAPLRTMAQLESRMALVLGADAARLELSRAIDELGLADTETRPRQLQLLRERLERNLSGLLGPRLARSVLGEEPDDSQSSVSGLLVEEELEHSQSRLRGLAAELNELRRFHRQVLQDLPIGVCMLGPDHDVLIWNERMTAISGVGPDVARGARLADLPGPWPILFRAFLHSPDKRRYKLRTKINGRVRWLNLHKEIVAERTSTTDAAESSGVTLLVEDLTEQQQLEAELVHSERLASIGTFAAGVAHEIGNPLTGISSIAQNLRSEDDANERREGLADILEQSRRIGEIVRTLLTFSHAGSDRLSLSEVDVADAVSDAVRLARLSRSGRQLVFDVSEVEAIRIRCDRSRLLQVLLNLLSNAADASAAGSTVFISAHQRGDQLHLAVRDTGCGIPDAIRERLFEPFFTTKEPGLGTGLGLSLVYRIVRDHHGSIDIDSREHKGSTFTLKLPLRPAGDANSPVLQPYTAAHETDSDH